MGRYQFSYRFKKGDLVKVVEDDTGVVFIGIIDEVNVPDTEDYVEREDSSIYDVSFIRIICGSVEESFYLNMSSTSTECFVYMPYSREIHKLTALEMALYG